jgi:ATP adenylyltransferase
MDYIWTPWRFHYIASSAEVRECVFCHILGEDPTHDRENLVLVRQARTFVLLNRFPYTSGHLMIVARRHIPSLTGATTEELTEIIDSARLSEAALGEVYTPDGFNMGFNIGKCAGAGVDGHLHLHVLPRWVGDANVVSVVGQTRVIPEELETTFDKLAPYFQKR